MRPGKERPEHVFDIWKTDNGYNYEEHIDANSYVTSETKVWRGSYRTLYTAAMYAEMKMREYLAACLDGRIAN